MPCNGAGRRLPLLTLRLTFVALLNHELPKDARSMNPNTRRLELLPELLEPASGALASLVFVDLEVCETACQPPEDR